MAADEGEDGVAVIAAETATSPVTGNGYAMTDVIDDLMAAEFPETIAPQADSEEVVLLSPTPPSVPPPPPPSDAEPEVDKPEEMVDDGVWVDKKPEEEGEQVAVSGHEGGHESRVTISGPLQFMGRNDLPRDDVTPPLSPTSSPLKLLDVLPAPLRDAAAVEATLGRAVPVTSGSIDAVTLDDTQSPWSAAETSQVDNQREVFNETPTTVPDSGDNDQGEARTTDVASPGASVDVPDSVAQSQISDRVSPS